jgi:hypothetical protein
MQFVTTKSVGRGSLPMALALFLGWLICIIELDQWLGDRRFDHPNRLIKWRGPMTDPADAIMAAIHSAFDSYPKEGDPEWRSPNWIMPEECAHLTKVIMRELEARGFQIVKKPS